jgi:hypothetical protein
MYEQTFSLQRGLCLEEATTRMWFRGHQSYVKIDTI